MLGCIYPIYSAAMPVLVSCTSLFVIHAYLGLGPDQSCMRVSLSVEHRIWSIGDLPYAPESHISKGTHLAAAVCLAPCAILPVDPG